MDLEIISQKWLKIHDVTYALCSFASDIDEYVANGAKVDYFCIDNDMTSLSVRISNMPHTKYPLQLPYDVFDLKFFPNRTEMEQR